MKYPPISIIIVTLNSERTLKDCLYYINRQIYSGTIEILLIDGGSKDKTFGIAKQSKIKVKIINGKYKENQEARRAIGILHAKYEICAFIDSDNYILDKYWLKKMVTPLVENNEIVCSQTLRYSAPPKSSLLNRYFGLIGGTDPVAYYLKINDRLSWAFEKWNLLGEVKKENKNYYIVAFDVKKYPTVGCNGIVFRKSTLKKAMQSPLNFFHTDVWVDVGKKGFNTFAIVKNEVFHNSSGGILMFLKKRRNYMKFYHQKLNKKRRYLTFDPSRKTDIINLLLYILFSLTIIEPLSVSIRGYMKKKDLAWFLHPFFCLALGVIYLEATITQRLRKFL